MSSQTKRIVVTVAVLVILFPFGYSLFSGILTGGSDAAKVFLERPDPKYKECVRETEYMRFHHMDLLKEVREEFVRYGNRSDIGFDSCRGCHTSRERFCNQCHEAVSLNIDCFGCHYYPEPTFATASLRKGGSR
jgi:hypothetical protein